MKQLLSAAIIAVSSSCAFAQSPSIGATQAWVKKYVSDYMGNNRIESVKTPYGKRYTLGNGYYAVIEDCNHYAIELNQVTIVGGIYGITNNTILAYDEEAQKFKGSGLEWDFTGTNIVATFDNGIVAIGEKKDRIIVFTDNMTNRVCEATGLLISKSKAEKIYAED